MAITYYLGISEGYLDELDRGNEKFADVVRDQITGLCGVLLFLDYTRWGDGVQGFPGSLEHALSLRPSLAEEFSLNPEKIDVYALFVRKF